MKTYTPTTDKLIRAALIQDLAEDYKDQDVRIIEELGILHGSARVDIAVVNGIIHGYELKSDLDTLNRLPDQMKFYNSVFDQITLVVGTNHLHEAIKIVPEWWGIMVAKTLSDEVCFYEIRDAEENPLKQSVPTASLLWRNEALSILEKRNQAKGVRSKSRDVIYERLASVLDTETLRKEIRTCLATRTNWRSA